MNTIDLMFTTVFSLATVASFISLTVMTINLPLEQDSRTLANSHISGKAITVFFVLMLIPVAFFSAKGLIWASVSTIALASVTAFCMSRMSARIRTILRKRSYC